MFSHRVNDDVELRLYEERFAQEVFDLTQANREHIAPWLPWIDNVKSVDDTIAFTRKGLEQFARNDGIQCGIWERGAYVGGIGMHWINRISNYTEIGYWLAKGAEGRGIITAASAAIVNHAFEAYKLNRVEIRCAAGNDRSRAVCGRLGFREEGTLKLGMKLRDTYHDTVIYGMLAAEWPGAMARLASARRKPR